jgi:hypothetical protein
LDQAGSLRSHDNLQPSNGLLTRSRIAVSKDDVLAAKTVRIMPTAFQMPGERAPFTPAQQGLVANAVDRMLCAGLSARFEVVAVRTRGPDLPCGGHACGANRSSRGRSVERRLGGENRSASRCTGFRFPPSRSGSAVCRSKPRRATAGESGGGHDLGRGANALGGSARVAQEGDAYDLAGAFGDDFSKLLVTGATPFGTLPSAPSAETLRTLFGRAPKYSACAAFGTSPGLVGMIGGGIGLPPDWTDKGAARVD